MARGVRQRSTLHVTKRLIAEHNCRRGVHCALHVSEAAVISILSLRQFTKGATEQVSWHIQELLSSKPVSTPPCGHTTSIPSSPAHCSLSRIPRRCYRHHREITKTLAHRWNWKLNGVFSLGAVSHRSDSGVAGQTVRDVCRISVSSQSRLYTVTGCPTLKMKALQSSEMSVNTQRYIAGCRVSVPYG